MRSKCAQLKDTNCGKIYIHEVNKQTILPSVLQATKVVDQKANLCYFSISSQADHPQLVIFAAVARRYFFAILFPPCRPETDFNY